MTFTTLSGNWQLSFLLTGVKRVHGNAPQQKLPINFDILCGIHSQLNLTYSVDAAFWAICLVAFYGMFRKSHLLNKVGSFDPGKQLTKADFPFFPGGALIRVRWSKTIQFREKVVQIPLIAGGDGNAPREAFERRSSKFCKWRKIVRPLLHWV